MSVLQRKSLIIRALHQYFLPIMHQLSLHYRTSHEINSTWLARILLLIFCLLILVWPSLMSCSIQQGLFCMECWNLALPPCFSQQSTAVCPRLGLWSKETGSFGCELQPSCGTSIKVSTPSSYTELSFLLWWADWKRAAVLFQLLYSLLCRDIIHLLSLCSVENTLYSNVWKNWLPNQLE